MKQIEVPDDPFSDWVADRMEKIDSLFERTAGTLQGLRIGLNFIAGHLPDAAPVRQKWDALLIDLADLQTDDAGCQSDAYREGLHTTLAGVAKALDAAAVRQSSG